MNISNTLVLVLFFSIVGLLLLAFIGYVIYILIKDRDRKRKKNSPPPARLPEDKGPQVQESLFRAILQEAKNKPAPGVDEIREELARIEAEDSGEKPAEEKGQLQG